MSLFDGTRSVALVHDYLLVMRGAERTFAELAELWPQAPVYTLLYDAQGTGGRFAGRTVVSSPLQRARIDQQTFRRLLPLYPSFARRLPLQEHAVVISSSSAFAHMVRPGAGAVHVSYCHSPFRYAWQNRDQALGELPRPLRPALSLALARHRRLDRQAAGRVTRFIANSAITRERIRSYWGRDAPIVHPPVHVGRFQRREPVGDDLLFVGELVRHKRIDLALEAAERAGRRVRVVGTGPDLPRLRSRFRRRVEFLGRIDDGELERVYATTGALVVPNVEEFGIAAVEAQAAGRPVIAADGGGARETVVDGETGWLVRPDDVEALAATMRRDLSAFDGAAIRRHAERFSPEAFRARMLEVLGDLL
jgi:glycosyltransferase involved in cell wall biosynthesis